MIVHTSFVIIGCYSGDGSPGGVHRRPSSSLGATLLVVVIGGNHTCSLNKLLVHTINKKRKTYQRLETHLRLEPLSAS